MDYSKLKVPELKERLTARSLPVSGKKEELIARLIESDAKAQSTANDLGDLAPPDEDYDWDTPTTKPAPKPDAKPPPTPTTVPQTTSTAPQAPAAVTTSAPKRALEASKPSSTTTAKPLPTATSTDATDAEASLAVELEKRKRRAERFGIPLADGAKALERAKRFGTTTTATEEFKKEARMKRFGNQASSENKDVKKPAQTSSAKPPVKRVVDDPVEAEKAKKRAERFGGGNEAKKVKT